MQATARLLLLAVTLYGTSYTYMVVNSNGINTATGAPANLAGYSLATIAQVTYYGSAFSVIGYQQYCRLQDGWVSGNGYNAVVTTGPISSAPYVDWNCYVLYTPPSKPCNHKGLWGMSDNPDASRVVL